ncbi:MAG: hypothetical protein FD165_2353 [Gammaproteobacteria bacterium]|nr:MAG: hypothetical protein FD165_2353 [Gammaproteobacteria bacterium]TND01427.1 MAG: hypothetical protein FD120_2600 [Gammaproteobacteria bacterium]
MRGKVLTVVYLAVALVFVQGVQLHLHTYSHGHDSGHEPGVMGHAHHNKAHSAHDLAGPGHADEAMSGIDITPAGLLKNLLSGSLVMALLAAAIRLLAPSVLATTLRRRTWNIHPVTGWHSYLPPLRAPPH